MVGIVTIHVPIHIHVFLATGAVTDMVGILVKVTQLHALGKTAAVSTGLWSCTGFLCHIVGRHRLQLGVRVSVNVGCFITAAKLIPIYGRSAKDGGSMVFGVSLIRLNILSKRCAKPIGNLTREELLGSYFYDLYGRTVGLQGRIAVYRLKTVVTEIIAILDRFYAPKRAKCTKKSLVGQIFTALKLTCKEAVFKYSLCIRVGKAEEAADINGWGVIKTVLFVIRLDRSVCRAVADGHFTGILLNSANKAARSVVHAVNTCIKGSVPRAVFNQTLVVCVSHKAADLANTVRLCGKIYIGGDILNDRAVLLQSVIGAVDTANRSDDTANVINLGIHNHIAVDGEVLDRTRSDFSEEAKPCSVAFHVQTLYGMILSVKDAAEIVAVLTRGADGRPLSARTVRFSFQVDVSHKNRACRSVYLVDMLRKPEELTAVLNRVVTNVCGVKPQRLTVFLRDERSLLIADITAGAEAVGRACEIVRLDIIRVGGIFRRTGCCQIDGLAVCFVKAGVPVYCIRLGNKTIEYLCAVGYTPIESIRHL